MNTPRNDADRLDYLSRETAARVQRAIEAASDDARRRAENDATILRALEQDKARG